MWRRQSRSSLSEASSFHERRPRCVRARTELNATSARRTPPRFLQAFKSLYIKDYRTLWIGMLFNVASMQVNIVARSWLAYDLSGSALILGVVAMARGLPQIIFSPLGGVAADRFDKRKVLVVSQSILCLLALVNAILVQTHLITVWQLIVIGIVQGIVFPFTMPTRQALIPHLVGDTDLPNALAVDSAGRNFNRVIAPSLAGVLIAWNPTFAFYAVAAFYFISAMTLTRLPRTGSTTDPNRNVVQQMMFGFRYMINNQRLLVLTALAFIAVVFGMPFQQMLPVFQASVLKVGADQLGFMYAAVGAGALVGSLLIAYRSDDPRRQTYQLIAGIGFGAFLIPFALSGSIGLTLVMLVFVGLCSEVFMTVNRMMVLLNTEARLYGRVMGTYAMTFSLMPIATLPMGALVDAIGAPKTVAGAGFLLVLAVVGISLWLPRVWQKEPAPLETV